MSAILQLSTFRPSELGLPKLQQKRERGNMFPVTPVLFSSSFLDELLAWRVPFKSLVRQLFYEFPLLGVSRNVGALQLSTQCDPVVSKWPTIAELLLQRATRSVGVTPRRSFNFCKLTCKIVRNRESAIWRRFAKPKGETRQLQIANPQHHNGLGRHVCINVQFPVCKYVWQPFSSGLKVKEAEDVFEN